MFFASRLRPIIFKSRRALVSRSIFVQNSLYKSPNMPASSGLIKQHHRLFVSKNDKPEKDDASQKEKEEDVEKEEGDDAVEAEATNKGMWFNTKQKLASKLLKQQTPVEAEEEAVQSEETETHPEELEVFEGKPVHKLYTIKFNSPILPYSKFPLTQNKYIQQFFKRYTKDKETVEKLIGVHFPGNKNSQSSG